MAAGAVVKEPCVFAKMKESDPKKPKSPCYDVVIDDGAKSAEIQFRAFWVLFPRLKTGGVYFVENVAGLAEQTGFGSMLLGRSGPDAAAEEVPFRLVEQEMLDAVRPLRASGACASNGGDAAPAAAGVTVVGTTIELDVGAARRRLGARKTTSTGKASSTTSSISPSAPSARLLCAVSQAVVAARVDAMTQKLLTAKEKKRKLLVELERKGTELRERQDRGAHVPHGEMQDWFLTMQKVQAEVYQMPEKPQSREIDDVRRELLAHEERSALLAQLVEKVIIRPTMLVFVRR